MKLDLLVMPSSAITALGLFMLALGGWAAQVRLSVGPTAPPALF